MKDLKELLGEELYNQVQAVLADNADYTVLVDAKKTPTFIPKTRFDEVNNQKTQYKEQNDQLVKDLETMKESAKGNEKLTAELEKTKLKLQSTEQQMTKVQLDAKISLAIHDTDAKNEKLITALIDREKIKFNDNGEIEGLDDQLKALKESDSYLFNLTPEGGEGKGGEKGGNPNVGGGTGNIGSGANGGGQGKPETIGAMLAKQKLEAQKASNPKKFFETN